MVATKLVEMSVARLRALTREVVNFDALDVVVEMSVARLRALTLDELDLVEGDAISRNECGPFEGIDTPCFSLRQPCHST